MKVGAGAARWLGVLACVGCSDPTQRPLFEDRTAACGLVFEHRHGGLGSRELPETMGGGVALLDVDGDGDLDVYLAQSGPMRLPGGRERRKGARNAVFANDGEGRFERVKGALGAGDPGYGQGVAAGDLDGDGRDDLLALNWGPNRIYRNEGGRFANVTHDVGFQDEDEWSVSAAFFDAEGDGDLDLYVVNYLWSPPGAFVSHGYPEGFDAYPHPDRFSGVADRLYENTHGRFVERTQEAGVYRASGKGLGVAPTDVDLDGLVDLYVANDSVPNFLFRNRGAFRFEEVGLVTGTAYNRDGMTEAGMGVDTADVDGDGDFDLFVTHLDGETNTLYLNDGTGESFGDGTDRSGLGEPSKLFVGFGALFEDFDLDGDEDLLVVNGHVLDTASSLSDVLSHAQPNHLYLGDGTGRFEPAEPDVAGPGIAQARVSRGTASGDLDGDGAPDVVIANNAGSVQVLFGMPRGRAWLSLRLEGPEGNHHGLGASVWLVLEDGRRRLHRVESARSYASSSHPVVATGLPAAVVEVEVLWPGGRRQRFPGLRDFTGRQVLSMRTDRRP